MTWYITGIVAFAVIYNIWRYYHDNDHNNYNSITESEPKYNEGNVAHMEETISTRQLALKIIENIGCEPQYDEMNRILFDYQGVTFLMYADDDCKYVNLFWPWCYSFSKFDIDEFARIRQVVNDINLHKSTTVVYSITDSDEVALHIKKNFLLVPQIPEMEEYLIMILNSFFQTARTLELEIEKSRMYEGMKHV